MCKCPKWNSTVAWIILRERIWRFLEFKRRRSRISGRRRRRSRGTYLDKFQVTKEPKQRRRSSSTRTCRVHRQTGWGRGVNSSSHCGLCFRPVDIEVSFSRFDWILAYLRRRGSSCAISVIKYHRQKLQNLTDSLSNPRHQQCTCRKAISLPLFKMT